ncbi:MAG: acetyl/propionyl/methylcrotonyl-CoA carboxylase subunit alpha, partial [Geminicoccaceae bacterium]
MFKKILIANRGEIACRIMRTAARLGVRTVAVYSDADAQAMHVAMADEAYRIGPPAALDSYLNIENILEAARASGADAVHPGYGFLSENPDFVEAVEKAGMTFIGPPAAAIRAMGQKDAAKALMEEAGVAVVPGYHGGNQDPDLLIGHADAIGYPVLIKTRSGGGGKGMRRVDDSADFRAALEGAAREAESSFGDGRCLIEKFLIKPRHIEIQIFGDRHGNVIHLFERDCSLQRRHQKVIEEAPAPGMGTAMRQAMGDAAVRAAQAVGYVGAGTVEFIADVSDGLSADRFYFMEMNTRLQVEHPVTEMITGQDLVEWQLRVAAGESLPLGQDELAIDGWAFEARIYAEDAAAGFLPATGNLDYLSLPDEMARVDSGVRRGDAVSPFYDPMLAKLIVHGQSREIALDRLSLALGQCHLAGVTTNIGFLGALAAHPDFKEGNVDTGLIDRHLDQLTAAATPSAEAITIAALVLGGLISRTVSADPWTDLVGWRLWSEARITVSLAGDHKPIDVDIVIDGLSNYRINMPDGRTLTVSNLVADCTRIQCIIDDRKVQADAVRKGGGVTVFIDGRRFSWSIADPLLVDETQEAAGDRLLAPMPGLVKAVDAGPGDFVSKNMPLIVMEAMKMELTLKAPRDGVVD